MSHHVEVHFLNKSGKRHVTNIRIEPMSALELGILLKDFKEMYKTNGTLIKDDKDSYHMSLQGDQRANIEQFVLKNSLCLSDEIVYVDK